MYIQVIPAVRLPKNFGEYDYLVPDQFRAQIKRGSWVIVPWRGRPVDAIVTAILEHSKIEPKKIKKIVGFGAERPLNEDLISIPQLIAQHYFVSPASVVKAFLPKTPKTKIITEIESSFDSTPVLPHPNLSPRLLQQYRSPTEKLSVTLKFLTEAAKLGSVIIITPHSEEVNIITQKILMAEISVPVIPLHGTMTTAKQRQAWKKIMSEPRAIVIGTRLAAFAPVNNPVLFLVLEADSIDLRQYDQNPRYDTREVLRWRAEAAGAGLVYLAHAFRPEEYLLTKKSYSLQVSTQSSCAATLVDIAGQPRSALTPLAPIVIQRINEALQSGKKVLLFHNRLGTAGALFCRDCCQVFRCPTCKIATTVLEKILRCGRCGFKEALPVNCSTCHGINLGNVGLGTAALAPLLQQEFPDNKINNYDSVISVDERRAALETANILIGTRLLLHDVTENGPSDGWGCIVATDIDALLSHQGFRTGEDAWRTVSLLRNLAATSDAKLFLQTVDPENPKIRQLLLDLEDFMKYELENRCLTAYPPCGELITVTIKADTMAQAEDSAIQFRQQAMKTSSTAQLAGPLRHSRPYRDGKWRNVIVIKTTTISEALVKLLKSLPEEYIVDRNPEVIG
ncbi:hypothetical protein KKE28_03710 [Patescibacteria group bacterium]|nr:hypothetical protein [Patescibacteria group bacterium]